MTLKLGIIGLSEGNGHPYSWSAICNGYDPAAMEHCGYPVISRYLEQHRWPDDQLQGARVTHIWTQDYVHSKHIAKACRIAHCVDESTQLIGKVDAVLLARDDAENHLQMAAPFLRAGLPVYIDKPVCLDQAELKQLYALQQFDGQIFSCSALRYAKEFLLSKSDLVEIGQLIKIEAMVPKDWDRYAVHVIEPMLLVAGDQGKLIAHQRWQHQQICSNNYAWESGFQATITTLADAVAPVSLRVIGSKGWKDLFFVDAFSAFKAALQDFVDGVSARDTRTDPNFIFRVVEMIELGRSK